MIVTVAVALLAVVAAVVASGRSVPTYDAGTPEGTVQAYLQAVFDGDDRTAASYLSTTSGCDVDDFRGAYVAESARVVLRDSRIDGDAAAVEVEIVFSDAGGPFDTYEWSEEQSFDLVREDDSWMLIGRPWPLYYCQGG